MIKKRNNSHDAREGGKEGRRITTSQKWGNQGKKRIFVTNYSHTRLREERERERCLWYSQRCLSGKTFLFAFF